MCPITGRRSGPGATLGAPPGVQIFKWIGKLELLATEGLKPAADIHLGVGFAAIVPGMGLVGRFLGPLENRELRIAAMDHDPPDRLIGLLTTNFTSIDRVNH